MKIIYVAGPFTAPTPWEIEQNVRRAEEAGFIVAQEGAMPLIPHANTRYFHGQQTAEFWYDGTLELLRRCDAILMMEGWENSRGSQAEHSFARANNMPVFYIGREPAAEVVIRRWLEGIGDERHLQEDFDRKLPRNCGQSSNRSGHPRFDSDHREEPG